MRSLNKFFVHTLSAAALAGFASSSFATVFDFENTPAAIVSSGAPFAQQDGFQLSVGDSTYGTAADYAIIDTAAAWDATEAPLGNSTQFYSSLGSWIEISRTDGGQFSLNSFDVAVIGAPTGTATSGYSVVVFVGQAPGYSYYDGAYMPSIADGGSSFYHIDLTHLYDGSGEDPSTLPDWSHLNSVQISLCVQECLDSSAGFNRFAVDNIDVTPVPEPSNVVLLMLGLAALAWNRLRANNSAQQG